MIEIDPKRLKENFICYLRNFVILFIIDLLILGGTYLAAFKSLESPFLLAIPGYIVGIIAGIYAIMAIALYAVERTLKKTLNEPIIAGQEDTRKPPIVDIEVLYWIIIFLVAAFIIGTFVFVLI